MPTSPSPGIRLVRLAAMAMAFICAIGGPLTVDAADNVAVQGYDVVSYFTDGKPVKGSSDISLPYDDSNWQFANAAHKDMFAADPDKFMPQYGGLCAGGMAMGVSVPANPDNWVIVDGKLYMLSGSKADLDEWLKNAAANIKEADANFAKMQQ